MLVEGCGKSESLHPAKGLMILSSIKKIASSRKARLMSSSH
jgi:hypothetical protein